MKKLLVLFIALFAFNMAVDAAKIPFTIFQANHKTMVMNADGTCKYQDSDYVPTSGTYDIQGEVVPGCSNVRVVFNFGGKVYYGTIMWPMQGKKSLYFDDNLFPAIN